VGRGQEEKIQVLKHFNIHKHQYNEQLLSMFDMAHEVLYMYSINNVKLYRPIVTDINPTNIGYKHNHQEIIP
jgi:hypothetical protein